MSETLKMKVDAAFKKAADAANGVEGYGERRIILAKTLREDGVMEEVLCHDDEDFCHSVDIRFEEFCLNRPYGVKNSR
jgi:hypothetical protein